MVQKALEIAFQSCFECFFCANCLFEELKNTKKDQITQLQNRYIQYKEDWKEEW